jgi:hypothetical protein
MTAAEQSLPASKLVGFPVRFRGIRLGSVEDAILDRGIRRLIGLIVSRRDGEPGFLAFSASRIGDRDVEPTSPLAVLEQDSLAFYREHGVSLLALREADVGGERVVDVCIRGDGAIEAVGLENGDGVVWRPRSSVSIEAPTASPAG